MARKDSQEDVLRTIMEKGNPIAAEQAKVALDALKADMARSMKENLSAINATNTITKKGADSQKETLQLTKTVAADIKGIKKGQDDLIKLAGKTNGLLGTILKDNERYYEKNNNLISDLLAESTLNSARSREMMKQMLDSSAVKGRAEFSTPSVPQVTPTENTEKSGSVVNSILEALGLAAAGKYATGKVASAFKRKPNGPRVEPQEPTAEVEPEGKVTEEEPPKVETEAREPEVNPSEKYRAGGRERVEPKLSMEPEPAPRIEDDFRAKPSDRIGAPPVEETYEDMADRAAKAKKARAKLGLPEAEPPRLEPPKVEPAKAPQQEIPENAFEPPEVKPSVEPAKSPEIKLSAEDRIGGAVKPTSGLVEKAPSAFLEGAKDAGKFALGAAEKLAVPLTVGIEGYQGYEEYSAAENARLAGKIKSDEANKRKAEAVTGTAGGIAGALELGAAGAELGAGVGTVFGPGGTVVGGILGGIGGGTLGAITGREGGKRLVELAGVQTEDEKKKNLEEYEREKKKIAQDNAEQAGVKYEEGKVKKRPKDPIAAQAWDYKYSAEYNPDGTHKNLEPAQKTPMSNVEKLEQGGTNSPPITIINQGDTINNNSGGNRNAGQPKSGAPGILSPTAPKNPWDFRLYGYPPSD